MSRSSWLWLLWILCPVFAVTFHYGPGQLWLARDLAGEKIEAAAGLAEQAERQQEAAYAIQLELIEARRKAFIGGVDWQSEPEHPLAIAVRQVSQRQTDAYQEAAKSWGNVTQHYSEAIKEVIQTIQSSENSAQEIADHDQYLLESLRWAEARAMVRSGLVFNGVDQFQALLDVRITEDNSSARLVANRDGTAKSRLPTDAIREELAAAQYIGARLLREEGRSPEIWKPVANGARQQYRLLAERELANNFDENDANGRSGQEIASEENGVANDAGSQPQGIKPQTKVGSGDSNQGKEDLRVTRAEKIQRNLEQVLNLEQSSAEQLEGIPLPRQAPMARRPGDGEPGDRPGKGPGRGPLQDGPPGEGAGVPGPFGSGW